MKRTLRIPSDSRPKWRAVVVAALVVAACCAVDRRTASAAWQTPPGGPDHGTFPSVTVLQSGKILVAGGGLGSNPFNNILKRCDLYDPETGEWTRTGDLTRPRMFHSATLLPDGRVLVVGGSNVSIDVYSSSADIYDPLTEQWSPAPKAKGGPRHAHASTLLDDGTVLIVGGYENPTYQIFDPATDTWSKKKKPLKKIEAPAETVAILLLDGRVLIPGGWEFSSANYRTTCILYDRSTDSWTRTGPLLLGSSFNMSYTLLESGEVLAAHGPNGPYELFDPQSLVWRAVDAPPSAVGALRRYEPVQTMGRPSS